MVKTGILSEAAEEKDGDYDYYTRLWVSFPFGPFGVPAKLGASPAFGKTSYVGLGQAILSRASRNITVETKVSNSVVEETGILSDAAEERDSDYVMIRSNNTSVILKKGSNP